MRPMGFCESVFPPRFRSLFQDVKLNESQDFPNQKLA